MMEKTDLEMWLTFSHALFFEMMPKELQAEMKALTPSAHAAMVDRQASKVDEALLAMARAAGEPEVLRVFNALEKETVIVLCSRWAHYQEAWKLQGTPHWLDRGQKDLWRAVFLAMMSDRETATKALNPLWPGLFEEPPGAA